MQLEVLFAQASHPASHLEHVEFRRTDPFAQLVHMLLFGQLIQSVELEPHSTQVPFRSGIVLLVQTRQIAFELQFVQLAWHGSQLLFEAFWKNPG